MLRHAAYILAAVSMMLAAGTQATGGQTRGDGWYFATIDTVNELIVLHDYERAETLLNRLEEAYPDSPSVQLQKTVLYFTWIDDYGTVDKMNDRFTTAVNQTVDYSNAILREDPDNAYVRFYRGSALAYRALYRSYTEGIRVSTIPSLISDATSGINELQRANQLNPSFADPLIGVGKYQHWKAQKFPWPFASEKDAREGIRILEQAIDDGLQFDTGAIQTLGWIYISEKRYDDAIALVQPYDDRYPESRFFREILGRAYLGKKDYDRATEAFQSIVEGLSPQERESNFIVAKYERWLAKIEQERGNYGEACLHAHRLRRLDFTGVHEDWLQRKMNLNDRIMQEACPKAQRNR